LNQVEESEDDVCLLSPSLLVLISRSSASDEEIVEDRNSYLSVGDTVYHKLKVGKEFVWYRGQVILLAEIKGSISYYNVKFDDGMVSKSMSRRVLMLSVPEGEKLFEM
jgi:hypothetical protein